jgi:WXG100 family type VII secretion target
MVRITVDTAGLERMTNALAAANAAIGAALADLDAEVATLQSAWSGEAREAYALAQARWRSDLDALNATLARAVEVSTSVRTRYGTTRQTIARAWGAR